MLQAVRASTGAFLTVEVQGATLIIQARGDQGQSMSQGRIYPSVEQANAVLRDIYADAVYYGLQVVNYAAPQA